MNRHGLLALALASLPLMLSACNQNSSAGADREAQTAPVPGAAPQMPAAEALDGIATSAIALETMSDADVAALGDLSGSCVFRTTEMGKPSLIYDEGAKATIKLNGKLITLPASGERTFADGDLRMRLRPIDGEGNAGLPEEELIIAFPGAKDEHGFRGYRQCGDASRG